MKPSLKSGVARKTCIPVKYEYDKMFWSPLAFKCRRDKPELMVNVYCSTEKLVKRLHYSYFSSMGLSERWDFTVLVHIKRGKNIGGVYSGVFCFVVEDHAWVFLNVMSSSLCPVVFTTKCHILLMNINNINIKLRLWDLMPVVREYNAPNIMSR